MVSRQEIQRAIADGILYRRLRNQTPHTIGDLNDVDLDTDAPEDNQSLIWNGSQWVPGSGAGTVQIEVQNPGADLLKGTPVYVSGTHGPSGKPQVAPAQANSASTMPAIGLTLTDITGGGEGYVVAAGSLLKFDTDTPAWDAGEALYVSPTSAGALTSTRPTGDTELVQKVALVSRRGGSTQGSVIVMGAGRTNDIPNGILNDSILLEHVTNTGSVTEVALRHGNQTLGENEVGIPVDRSCTTNSAVVTWRADTAPAGNWTLTLKKKAAGSRTYTTAATFSVTVNNG